MKEHTLPFSKKQNDAYLYTLNSKIRQIYLQCPGGAGITHIWVSTLAVQVSGLVSRKVEMWQGKHPMVAELYSQLYEWY